jgi:hypothetical protein
MALVDIDPNTAIGLLTNVGFKLSRLLNERSNEALRLPGMSHTDTIEVYLNEIDKYSKAIRQELNDDQI